MRPTGQKSGVAAEATRLLAQAGFAYFPLDRIEIVVAVENLASQKAAEKAGAKREGTLRNRLVIGSEAHDAVMFSLVREDVGA